MLALHTYQCIVLIVDEFLAQSKQQDQLILLMRENETKLQLKILCGQAGNGQGVPLSPQPNNFVYTVLMKIYSIVKGWWTLLKSKFGYVSPTLKQFAAARLSVCATCEHRSKVTCTCNICGCYLPAKVQVYTENCPDNRWMPVHYFIGSLDDYDVVIMCEEIPPMLRESLYTYLGYEPQDITLSTWEAFLNKF
jgi:hypothetical protein